MPDKANTNPATDPTRAVDDTAPGFLIDLAARLFTKATPAMGIDQGDTDRLIEIAKRLAEPASLPCKSGEGAEIKPHVVEFLEAVRAAPGCKHPVECYYDLALGDDIRQEPSWRIAENAGWVICNGSHKWTITEAGSEALIRHQFAALTPDATQTREAEDAREIELGAEYIAETLRLIIKSNRVAGPLNSRIVQSGHHLAALRAALNARGGA